MTNKPPTERRAWRTDEEWARLRERITAGDIAAPARTRGFVAGRARWMVTAAAIVIVASGVTWRALRLARQNAAPAPLAEPQVAVKSGY